jgi:hypothetical protein
MYKLISSVATLALTVACVRGDDAVIPDEAVRAWKAHTEAARKLSVRVRAETTSEDGSNKPDSSVHEYHIRSTPGCLWYEYTDGQISPLEPDKQNRVVKVVNRNYEFAARRAAGEAAWALTEVTPPREFKAAPKDRVTTRDGIEASFLLPTLAATNATVLRLIGHPFFRVLAVERLIDNAREVVDVQYTIGPDAIGENLYACLHGSLRFDPANRWLLRSSVSRLKNGRGGVSTMRKSFTYGEGERAVPLPAEVVVEVTEEGGDYRSRSRITYEWLGPTTLGDGAFTLTAFGIPEEALGRARVGPISGDDSTPRAQTPAEQVEAGRPWYWAVLAVAGGLVVFGLVARYLINRRRGADT